MDGRHWFAVALVVAVAVAGGCLGDDPAENGSSADGSPSSPLGTVDGRFETQAEDKTLAIAWNDSRRVFTFHTSGGINLSAYDLPPAEVVRLNIERQCLGTAQFAYNYTGWVAEIRERGGRFALARNPRFPERVLRRYEPVNVTMTVHAAGTRRVIGRCTARGERDVATENLLAD